MMDNPFNLQAPHQQQQKEALTLSQFTKLVRDAVNIPQLMNRYVIAELSDVRVSGHCYMELLEKDASGRTLAKMRATLWRNTYYNVADKFRAVGMELKSGIKVMLRGSISFHEQYGLAFNVTDIDPNYTLGDMERLRQEILRTLQREGVRDNNKRRPMPLAPQRIAVISSAGAAGYGDFINQLAGNPYGLKFYPALFEAVMQGERTAPTIINAMQRIECVADAFDCVLIIRGGGSTTDLNGFDNLELARTVATYVLPVIVGIGHERDNTVLDYIAHTRVKTPTAAAEWLVAQAAEVLATIENLMNTISLTARNMVSGSREQLAQLETYLHAACSRRLREATQKIASLGALIPQMAINRLARARQQLDNLVRQMPLSGAGAISLQRQRLDYMQQNLMRITNMRLEQARRQLDQLQALANALSPEATLKRGYSLTIADGHVVADATKLLPGTRLTTRLAHGSLLSTVEKVNPQ